MNDDDLSTALRDRVQDEHPDLDRLIRISTRTGTRLRHRRAASVAIAGVAAAAVTVGILGATLGGSRPTPGVEPTVATQPTPSAVASTPPDVVSSAPAPQRLPVRVAPRLRGWEIGTPADEKFRATKGDAMVSVNVRPEAELGAWSGGDADRPAHQVVHVGANYFVTVQPGPGAPQAVVDELVHALRYQPRWRQ